MDPIKDLYILLVKLKGDIGLEALSGGIGYEETEVNMDDMPLLINKDIAIMAVLDL